MMTVSESPQARLRRELGLGPRSSGRPCVGDWMKFHTGDIVCRTDDPRHCGRIEAIRHGAYAVVRWQDNGWYEDVELNELRRAP